MIWVSANSSSRAAELASAPILNVDTPVATEGYFVLSWHSEVTADTLYILEQANDADFSRNLISRNLYRNAGQDPQITLSGLENGNYYFRMRQQEGDWGPTRQVTVQHHSLGQALLFFGLGLALLLTLCGTILVGWRQSRARPERG